MANINYWMDVLLCGLIVIWQIIKALGISILIQFVFYRFFHFNIYKQLLKLFDI